MCLISKFLSSNTKFAIFPGSMLPNLSYIPMAFAGLTAAHFIALSNGIFIFLTAVLTYWPFLGMALIFYFMLYRPQKKDQKKRELLLNSLKKGDKVITVGGIHGVIAAVSKTKVTLTVAENVKIDFELAAVTRFQDQTKQDMATK